jgi:hypothetical protein
MKRRTIAIAMYLAGSAFVAISSTDAAPLCDVDSNGTVSVTDGVNVLRAAASLPSTCDRIDLTGSWTLVLTPDNTPPCTASACAQYTATWTLVQSGTSISGASLDPPSCVQAAVGRTIAGGIDGTAVQLMFLNTAGPSPGHTENFTGTVSNSGTEMSGTGFASQGQCFTWVATR